MMSLLPLSEVQMELCSKIEDLSVYGDLLKETENNNASGSSNSFKVIPLTDTNLPDQNNVEIISQNEEPMEEDSESLVRRGFKWALSQIQKFFPHLFVVSELECLAALSEMDHDALELYFKLVQLDPKWYRVQEILQKANISEEDFVHIEDLKHLGLVYEKPGSRSCQKSVLRLPAAEILKLLKPYQLQQISEECGSSEASETRILQHVFGSDQVEEADKLRMIDCMAVEYCLDPSAVQLVEMMVMLLRAPEPSICIERVVTFAMAFKDFADVSVGHFNVQAINVLFPNRAAFRQYFLAWKCFEKVNAACVYKCYPLISEGVTWAVNALPTFRKRDSELPEFLLPFSMGTILCALTWNGIRALPSSKQFFDLIADALSRLLFQVEYMVDSRPVWHFYRIRFLRIIGRLSECVDAILAAAADPTIQANHWATLVLAKNALLKATKKRETNIKRTKNLAESPQATDLRIFTLKLYAVQSKREEKIQGGNDVEIICRIEENSEYQLTLRMRDNSWATVCLSSKDEVVTAFYEANFPHLGLGNRIDGSSCFVSLFGIFMWDELFMPLEAAFMFPVQKAPLDLISKDFYLRRSDEIDAKLEVIKSNFEEFVDFLGNCWEERSKVRQACLVEWDLFSSFSAFKELVLTIGSSVVILICQMFSKAFSTYSRNCPDFLFWNSGKNSKIHFVFLPRDDGDKQVKLKTWGSLLIGAGAIVDFCALKSL